MPDPTADEPTPNYVVRAESDTVSLYIAEVGLLRMTPTGAHVLAQELLDAVNEILPGTVMKNWSAW